MITSSKLWMLNGIIGIIFAFCGVLNLATASRGTFDIAIGAVDITIGAAFCALSWRLKKPSNGADDARR